MRPATHATKDHGHHRGDHHEGPDEALHEAIQQRLLGFVDQRRQASIGRSLDAGAAMIAGLLQDRFDLLTDLGVEFAVVDVFERRDADIDPPQFLSVGLGKVVAGQERVAVLLNLLRVGLVLHVARSGRTLCPAPIPRPVLGVSIDGPKVTVDNVCESPTSGSCSMLFCSR